MRLPHLDQRIALHPGEAGQLAYAVDWMLTRIVQAETPRGLATVLSLGPLERVRGRLAARERQQQLRQGPPPRKPRCFTLRYDELAALMLILPVAPPAGAAWGAVQQASLNLERYIHFAAYSG